MSAQGPRITSRIPRADRWNSRRPRTLARLVKVPVSAYTYLVRQLEDRWAAPERIRSWPSHPGSVDIASKYRTYLSTPTINPITVCKWTEAKKPDQHHISMKGIMQIHQIISSVNLMNKVSHKISEFNKLHNGLRITYKMKCFLWNRWYNLYYYLLSIETVLIDTT